VYVYDSMYVWMYVRAVCIYTYTYTYPYTSCVYVGCGNGVAFATYVAKELERTMYVYGSIVGMYVCVCRMW
jgi:hypothetical protein